MSELERILKDTLTTMEQEITSIQETHKKTLEEHSQTLHRLQQNLSRIEAKQQESARHLQHLSDIHTNLEPLLSRLSALLNAN